MCSLEVSSSPKSPRLPSGVLRCLKLTQSLEPGWCGFKSWLLYLLAVWLHATVLILPNLNFLCYQMGLIIAPFFSGKIKLKYVLSKCWLLSLSHHYIITSLYIQRKAHSYYINSCLLSIYHMTGIMLALTTILKSKNYPHLIDEETGSQRDYVIYPKHTVPQITLLFCHLVGTIFLRYRAKGWPGFETSPLRSFSDPLTPTQLS